MTYKDCDCGCGSGGCESCPPPEYKLCCDFRREVPSQSSWYYEQFPPANCGATTTDMGNIPPCDIPDNSTLCFYGDGNYTLRTRLYKNGGVIGSTQSYYSCPGGGEPQLCPPPNSEANWFVDAVKPDCNQCDLNGDQDVDQGGWNPAGNIEDICDSDCGTVATTITAATYRAIETAPADCDGLDNDCDGIVDEGGCACVDADNPGCCAALCTDPMVWDAAGGVCAGAPMAWEAAPPQKEWCCGDDSGESYRYFNQFDVPDCDDVVSPECVGRNDDPADAACCDVPTDCVLSGVCYQNVTGSADVDGDGVVGETCSAAAGKWRDCDADVSLCTAPRCGSLNWSAGGEAAAFGEYNTGIATECCGDDLNESFVRSFYSSSIETPLPVTSACCDDVWDCVLDSTCYTDGSVADIDVNNDTDICTGGFWQDCLTDADCGGGLCCDAGLNCSTCGSEAQLPGGCDDAVDNDGDTFVDQDDPDCCGNCSGIGRWWDMDAGGGCGVVNLTWESPLMQNQSCCGDDAGNEYKRECASGGDIAWAADCWGDQVCCSDPDAACVDPVLDICYDDTSSGDGIHNVSSQDGNDAFAVCGIGWDWNECDSGMCQFCAAEPGWPQSVSPWACVGIECQVASGEAGVGEFDADGAVECCGDDTGEYFIRSGADTACCDSADDCVDASGDCQVKDIWSPGGCTDGIDSDCDGLIDFVPDDAYADDPNCSATIDGALFGEDGSPLVGVNVTITAGATDPVTLVYVEFSTVTDTGAYSLDVIVNLTYNLVARLQTGGIAYEWDELVDESNGRRRTVDLTVRTAAGCEPDCTLSGEDYCRPECEGAAGCAFTSIISMQACEGSQPGWTVPYNATFDVQCCEGTPTPRAQARVVGVRGARDVVRVTRIVSYGGQLISLIIDVFQ